MARVRVRGAVPTLAQLLLQAVRLTPRLVCRIRRSTHVAARALHARLRALRVGLALGLGIGLGLRVRVALA